MKYIRRFNESHQESYQEITYTGEFTSEEKEWDDIQRFSSAIIKYIKSISKKETDFNLLSFTNRTYSDTDTSSLNILYIQYPSNEICIGVDKDEWFYVIVRNLINSGEYVDGIYKCDQLEGLFQLLHVIFSKVR
jgi:hypothetical protein